MDSSPESRHGSADSLQQPAPGIPENVIPMSIVHVGHPAATKAPRTQYDERRVYWQCYEPRKRRAKIKNAKYTSY